jgi:hypothetical protein
VHHELEWAEPGELDGPTEARLLSVRNVGKRRLEVRSRSADGDPSDTAPPALDFDRDRPDVPPDRPTAQDE